MALFTSNASSLADFTEGSGVYTATGETVAIAANAGRTGTGDSALKISVTNSTNEVGIRVGNIGGEARKLRYDFKLAATGSLSGFQVVNHIWYGDTGAYDGSLVQIGIKESSRVSGKYNFTMQTPYDGYASLSLATKPLSRDTWYSIEIRVSDDQAALYVAEYTSGGLQDYEYQTYARVPMAGRNIRAASIGKFQVFSGTNGYAGDLYVDNIVLDVAPAPSTPTDDQGKIVAAYEGWRSISMRPSDGAIVRHMGYESGGSLGDGNFGYSFPGSDVVSEGQPYGMIFAVVCDDQENFDLMETFAYEKLCRRNTQTATAINNAESSPIAPNLMGWKWEDDTNRFYDANWATDADVDRIKALYWAHKRWGSSGTINYLSRANAAAADLKNYSFRQDTATIDGVSQTIQIMSADKFNSGSSFEINPSYFDPVCYELAKEYNASDATFWTQAITGTYHALNTNALVPTYGSATEWATYSTTTHSAIERPERTSVRGAGWGYNSFRTMHRVYMHWKLHADTRAQSYLTNAFRTFTFNEWNNASPQRLAMEKEKTGVGLYSGYEKSMNTYAQWLTQRMGTPTSISSTIWNTKLDIDTLFRASSNGSFFADNPGDNDPDTAGDTGNFSYFNASWMLFSYILEYATVDNATKTFSVSTTTEEPEPTTVPVVSSFIRFNS